MVPRLLVLFLYLLVLYGDKVVLSLGVVDVGHCVLVENASLIAGLFLDVEDDLTFII
jgi:hypothetical protein